MKFIVFKLSTVKKICLCVFLFALFCVNLNSSTVATVYLGQAQRKVPIYSVETDEKQVAISFDAAWGADKTQKIMTICKEYGVNATFFLVGFWVEKYADMVAEINENGFEIGTHSNTHPDMAKLSSEMQKSELQSSIKLIEDITKKKVKLFRAPFGSYNNSLLETAESLNLQTIQWDVDSLDWKGISAEQITMRILNGVKNGSIILCHNNSDHIVDALPLVLDRLQKKGYKITCVGDLVMKDNYTIDHTGLQKKTTNAPMEAKNEL